MSTVNLIAVETGLLLSAMAFAAWVSHAAHRAAMEVYSGVRDGVRLSRRTRRLFGSCDPGLPLCARAVPHHVIRGDRRRHDDLQFEHDDRARPARREGLGQAHSSLVVPITAAGRPDGQCLRVTSG
jgi:hypothetical protein